MLKPGAKPPPMPPPGDEKLQEYLRKHAEDLTRDFADLCHYKSENAALKGARPTAIFMGDSITEAWGLGDTSLFSGGIVDRGISGQTSPQMLVRFYQDVVALHPKAVHIMAGTNDVAGRELLLDIGILCDQRRIRRLAVDKPDQLLDPQRLLGVAPVHAQKNRER